MNIVGRLKGRLTDNPEITSNGNTLISNFTLKISNCICVHGKEHISFVSCVCFGKLAEISQRRLKEGSLIAIQGKTKEERNKFSNQRIKVIIEKISILEC